MREAVGNGARGRGEIVEREGSAAFTEETTDVSDALFLGDRPESLRSARA